ncbi:MAG TPA: zinc ribbon domain-containing protein [Candidatus Limnocylindrales bacterium]|nr:zinc ribbon domain-containing protein [Candidatus Limnocylindrales bacterium]
MRSCPRCRTALTADTPFCPQCGAQLRVPTVDGEVLDAPRAAQGRRAVNPWIAAGLSIIPGLGHLYAGTPLRGLAFLVGVLGPEVIGTELDLTVIGDVIGVPLNLGGIALWAFCALDAYRTAHRRNAASP